MGDRWLPQYVTLLTAAIIGTSIPAIVHAQDADVIRGRIISADGMPVEGARVTATMVSSAVQRPTRTNRDGRYTIFFPDGDGHYMISVSQIGFVVRNFELRRTADQDFLVGDATLQKVQLEPVVTNANVRGTVGRGSTTADVGGTDVGIPSNSLTSVQTGDLAAMAASLPGVLMLGGANGGMPGFSVLGLDPSDNSITLNGMTFDGGNLPRDAGITSGLVTNPYDVSRGGFAGAQLNVRTSGGSNIITRGMSLNIIAPQLSWTDRASQAQGRDSTNLSFSGLFAGPFKYNASYYRLSFQFDRNANPLQTLVNTNALGLRSAGVAADSAARLVGILGQLGIPAVYGASFSNAVQNRASVAAALNLTPTASARAATYALNVNASWNNNEPQGATTRSVPAFGTENESRQASVQFRHSAYYKILLSETSVGVNGSTDVTRPFLDVPSARVRVNSVFDDGGNGVTDLSFGGNQNRGATSTRSGASFTNALSWFSENNKHRLKLATEFNLNSTSSEQSNNYLGTFAYNSLADLEAGIPASFSRQLTVRETRASQLTGAVSLGDSYRHNADLQIQFGVRADGGSYGEKPEFNPAVESVFGVRNDHVPARIYISPRVGFSLTLGKIQQIAAFEDEAATPRAILRGGIAVQQSALGSISSVINNTGLPGAIQSLNCVGAATPIPDWDLYFNNPDLVPAQCADGTGATVFSNSSPGVTLYASNYETPRSLRSNLSWQRAILSSRFNLTVSGTHSLNLNRGSQVDLNFDPTVRFTLDSEGGRPVFVQPSSIVPTTGAIASRDARVSQSFSRVNELRSDLRSESSQLQFRLTPMRWVPIRGFSWRLAYTWQEVREQQRGFSSTVGNPLEVYWSRGSSTARHQITYNLGYTFFRAIGVGWNGSITSGRPYTPGISGDVNGDGSSNDRPFIFDPATTPDPELAASMQRLLTNTSPDARECLLRQLGQLARRNSCTGRWTVTGDLMIRFDAARLHLPAKTAVEFSFQNPLGGADLLINGSRNLKGWGQGQETVDATLLYVRGFDPNTNSYRYEVNERFGTPRRTLITMRQPVRVTALVKMDLGPVRERQTLERNLMLGRSITGTKYPEATIKSTGVSSIPNPITSILRQADTLRLTPLQADSIARLNRRYTVRLDSIWGVAALHLSALPDDYSFNDAWHRYLSSRRAALDIMIVIAPAIRDMLTPAQLRKLPASLTNALDTRYLNAIRSGSTIYTGVAWQGIVGGGG